MRLLHDQTARLAQREATRHALRAATQPLGKDHGSAADATDYNYDSLMAVVGDARLVLLGEASHGTHEFYAARCEITKRLISERGFTAVAVEADWPDAFRVNCYVRGASEDANADEALGSFRRRFPTWMWRNTVVRDFVEWLRTYNAGQPHNQAGFYGLDLYNLFGSLQAVISYLESVDPDAARQARERYACFEHFGEDSQRYGWTAGFDLEASCHRQVMEQFYELQKRAHEYALGEGPAARDAFFYAEQNARLVKNAEEYYRSMFRGRVSSWNLRDCHMAETLDDLIHHLDLQNGRPTRVVVWAHNSHLGNARATEMGQQGELNVGQLARERYQQQAFLTGFTTYSGTVTAASNWDDPPERKRVRPALPDSYEDLLHDLRQPDFMLPLRNSEVASSYLGEPRLERAIGVIYRPETERLSHYFHAVLPAQFDAVLHFDDTRAVEPLEITRGWEAGEPPETFPTGV